MLGTSLKTVGIDHTVLHVSDLERSKRFYMDILGMTMNHESSWQAFLWCGKQQVALFVGPQDKVLTSGVELNHMALNLDTGTNEEVRQYLEGHGVKVFGRPGDPDCLYFEDPDGHRLQVIPTDHNQ